MNTTKMLDFPNTGTPVPDTTSATLYVQGNRDQVGVASGIIFNNGTGTNYTLEIQGAAQDDGVNTVWHPLVGSQVPSGTPYIDQRVGGIAFTIEFPLMPLVRMVFTNDAGGDGYDRCEAWITE